MNEEIIETSPVTDAPIIQSVFNTVSAMKHTEIVELSYHLQKYHAIFNRFLNLGTPMFDTRQPTAAVYAERETGRFLYLRINPLFWSSCSIPQRMFVIAHECIHLILGHLVRLTDFSDHELANIAVDLVTNHMCVTKFGFKRSEIDPENAFCWIDKYFEPEENIPLNETAEFYYNKLVEKKNAGTLNTGSGTFDQHNVLTQEDIDEFIKQMDKFLSNKDKQFLKSVFAGQGNSGQWTFYDVEVKKKKKWETVIRHWVLQTIGRREKPEDQWARKDRRFQFISNGKNGLFFPAEKEFDEPLKEKKKTKVFFFLDTSGSCHHLGERFFKAAKSLPDDKFEIRLFCFHDYVVETDITDNKVHNGAGTNFQIIENEVQRILSSGEEKDIGKQKYSVWVITDGAGTPINAANPENYNWFLSEDNKQYIPEKSNVYLLEDYE